MRAGRSPRPTFRALSHLSTLDSRRSNGGKEEITHSLLAFKRCFVLDRYSKHVCALYILTIIQGGEEAIVLCVL